MSAVQAKSENLLEGALLPKIIRFVVPLILTNLLQMLYNAADMIVVGMSPVEGALGAIGTTGAMISLIINVFIGIFNNNSVMYFNSSYIRYYVCDY